MQSDGTYVEGIRNVLGNLVWSKTALLCCIRHLLSCIIIMVSFVSCMFVVTMQPECAFAEGLVR
jgi:hypothetical protein